MLPRSKSKKLTETDANVVRHRCEANLNNFAASQSGGDLLHIKIHITASFEERYDLFETYLFVQMVGVACVLVCMRAFYKRENMLAAGVKS